MRRRARLRTCCFARLNPLDGESSKGATTPVVCHWLRHRFPELNPTLQALADSIGMNRSPPSDEAYENRQGTRRTVQNEPGKGRRH
jgi:hypothetical protein